MKQAAIITIGNELLAGKTQDSNTTWLARRLFEIGIELNRCHIISDSAEQIVDTLEYSARNCEILILTGGLGPTADDLTRQAIARFLNTQLQTNPKLLENIRNFFKTRNKEMPKRNAIQACIPENAEFIKNSQGTAPGIAADKNGNLLFALPGVPSEMKKMFTDFVQPRLKAFQSQQNQFRCVKRLKCFGAGESTIAQMIDPMMKRHRNPEVNSTVSRGVITLHIIGHAETFQKAEELCRKDQQKLKSILGSLIFGTEDDTLAKSVVQTLTRKSMTLSVAESCTGGLLSKLITDVSGASDCFDRGWITYTNNSKSSELSVDPQLIEQHGAVSQQVAQALACGAKQKAKTDFGIGVTGIAGPSGGTEQKPVGLVYIGVVGNNYHKVEHFIFSGERNSIRLRAAQTALNMLRLVLSD